MSAAHTGSNDDRVTRWVNAFGAVAQALGSQPPSLEILRPDDNGSWPAGFDLVFSAQAEDIEDGFLEISWESSIDGFLGTSWPFDLIRDDLSIGVHTITASATDSDGLSASESISFEITNDQPVMEIVSPVSGFKYVDGEQILLRATSQDDFLVELDDAQVIWTSNIDGALGSGHELLTTLSQGAHTITVEGTDAFGATGMDTVQVDVNPPPPDLPPSVQITSPEYGEFIFPNFATDLVKITLEGFANDPEDGALTGVSLVWSVRTNGGAVQMLGTGISLPVELPDAPGCENFWSQEITLTATDSFGNVRSDTIVINDGSIVC